MAKLRTRLAQRQKIFDADKGWFEGWFSQSLWMTTLISTLVGPVVMLLLILMIGSCLFKKVVSLLRERVQVLEMMAMYERL